MKLDVRQACFEKQLLKTFVMFSPIFVAYAKIIFGYNFGAPLTIFPKGCILDVRLDPEYASVMPQIMCVKAFQRPTATCFAALTLS